MASVNDVLQNAEKWVGGMFRPGVPAQCAYFVRHVFESAGVPLGVAAHPSDGMSSGEGYADSFAGDDVGPRVARADLQPGDLVMFANTYGSFPPGVYTHVGIFVGDGDMIDRPTSSEPVQRRSIDIFQFGEARRPAAFVNAGPAEPERPPARLIKVFGHDGKLQVIIDGQAQAARSIEIIIGY